MVSDYEREVVFRDSHLLVVPVLFGGWAFYEWGRRFRPAPRKIGSPRRIAYPIWKPE